MAVGSSATYDVNLTNHTAGSIAILDLNLTATSFDYNVSDTNCSGTIEPFGVCTITVGISPKIVGIVPGTLYVETDLVDPGRLEMPLYAKGTAASASAALQSVEIRAGWNLLSLPGDATLDTMSLAETFGSHAGSIDYLAKYSPLSGWSYYTVDAYADSQINRFTELRTGEGFWLKAGASFSLGYAVAETNATVMPYLRSGWNLVGLTTAMPIQEFLDAYAGYSVVSVWIYQDGTWKIFVPNDELDRLIGSQIPRIQSISPFDGVWINIL